MQSKTKHKRPKSRARFGKQRNRSCSKPSPVSFGIYRKLSHYACRYFRFAAFSVFHSHKHTHTRSRSASHHSHWDQRPRDFIHALRSAWVSLFFSYYTPVVSFILITPFLYAETIKPTTVQAAKRTFFVVVASHHRKCAFCRRAFSVRGADKSSHNNYANRARARLTLHHRALVFAASKDTPGRVSGGKIGRALAYEDCMLFPE